MKRPFLLAALSSLFLAGFVAATLLPAQSEGLLAYLIMTTDHSVFALVTVATVGNVLGSLVNYAFGLGVGHLQALQFLRPNAALMARAQQFYQRYGRWSLLLSWVPIIGDPLTLVAGVMREKLWRFLLLVSAAKMARYIIVAYFADQYAG